MQDRRTEAGDRGVNAREERGTPRDRLDLIRRVFFFLRSRENKNAFNGRAWRLKQTLYPARRVLRVRVYNTAVCGNENIITIIITININNNWPSMTSDLFGIETDDHASSACFYYSSAYVVHVARCTHPIVCIYKVHITKIYRTIIYIKKKKKCLKNCTAAGGWVS